MADKLQLYTVRQTRSLLLPTHADGKTGLVLRTYIDWERRKVCVLGNDGKRGHPRSEVKCAQICISSHILYI